MKKSVAVIMMTLFLFLCSCTAKMEEYPTNRTDLYYPDTERIQTLDEGQKAGAQCAVPSRINGVEISLPEQEQVSFLLYIYSADKAYTDTVGKVSPVFKKEISVSAAESTVTVYFNGPDAGSYYVVLEAKASMQAIFCLPCDNVVGYANGQISATVPKLSLLCE